MDFRLAVRGLLKRPFFAAIVTATFALGIGANTAVFTVVNAVALRPLPFREPERLVDVAAYDVRGGLQSRRCVVRPSLGMKPIAIHL